MGKLNSIVKKKLKELKSKLLVERAIKLRKEGKLFAAARIELKLARKGLIHAGIKPASEKEKRRVDFLLKSKSHTAIKFDFEQYKENQRLEREIENEILLEKSISITIYSEEHSCSRKIARKAMSSERRLAKKSA